MKIIRIERKSAVLGSSDLACLAGLPSINVTCGCAHQCLYCYARGYRSHPGDATLAIYDNLPDRLRRELQRKRIRPKAVYFCPSSDLFQPVPEVLALAEEVLNILFHEGIGVRFLTKGHIPPKHLRLLRNHASLVHAQIGLISLDSEILSTFEPHAACAEARLQQAKELSDGGVQTQVRLDPILPGLTSDPATLEALCDAIRRAGVREIAASVLFLRPAIAHSLARNTNRRDLSATLLAAFAKPCYLTIRAGQSRVHAISPQIRRGIFERLSSIASTHGLRIHFCGCKNPDLTQDTCHLAGTPACPDASPRDLPLFPS